MCVRMASALLLTGAPLVGVRAGLCAAGTHVCAHGERVAAGVPLALLVCGRGCALQARMCVRMASALLLARALLRMASTLLLAPRCCWCVGIGVVRCKHSGARAA